MTSARGRPVSPGITAALDVILVLGFAAIGRASHREGVTASGVVETAWPFLVGLALGWALVRWRSGAWPARVGHGVTIWVCTVGGGMLLRVASGAGVEPAFVLVAAAVLGALLLGSRLLLAPRPRRGVPVR